MWTSIVLPLLALAGGPAELRDAPNTSGVPFPDVPEFDADPAAHGLAIAEHADLFDRGWRDEVSVGQMTLHDAGGDSVARRYSRTVLENPTEGDKLIIRFLSPAEIKGVAALTHEKPGASDDNWLYLPSSKKVRRISGANKTASFQGTEFTYEDLSNFEVTEYDWRYIGEGELERDGATISVLRVEAVPNYADTGYSRLVVSYHPTEFRRERVEFYDKAGQLLKTLNSDQWELHHGRFWRSNRFLMENHQTGKYTELINEKVYVNLSQYKSSSTGEARANLDDSSFTTQALQL